MDFERGIWQTSLDGDVNRVRKLLHKGRDPNSRDGSGYTALVNHVLKHQSIPSFNFPLPPPPLQGNSWACNCCPCAGTSRFHAILIVIIIVNNVISGCWLLTNPNSTSIQGTLVLVLRVSHESSSHTFLFTHPLQLQLQLQLQLHLPNLIVK